MPVQWQHIVQASNWYRIKYHRVFCLLVFLVRFGKLAQSKRHLKTPLTDNPQQTLPPIDLTSFLHITGQTANSVSHTKSPESATFIPRVKRGPWTSKIEPAPAGSATTAVQTARDPPTTDTLIAGELR